MLRLQRNHVVRTTLKAQSQESHCTESAQERLALVWLVTQMVWMEDLAETPRLQRGAVRVIKSRK